MGNYIDQGKKRDSYLTVAYEIYLVIANMI